MPGYLFVPASKRVIYEILSVDKSVAVRAAAALGGCLRDPVPSLSFGHMLTPFDLSHANLPPFMY